MASVLGELDAAVIGESLKDVLGAAGHLLAEVLGVVIYVGLLIFAQFTAIVIKCTSAAMIAGLRLAELPYWLLAWPLIWLLDKYPEDPMYAFMAEVLWLSGIAAPVLYCVYVQWLFDGKLPDDFLRPAGSKPREPPSYAEQHKEQHWHEAMQTVVSLGFSFYHKIPGARALVMTYFVASWAYIVWYEYEFHKPTRKHKHAIPSRKECITVKLLFMMCQLYTLYEPETINKVVMVLIRVMHFAFDTIGMPFEGRFQPAQASLCSLAMLVTFVLAWEYVSSVPQQPVPSPPPSSPTKPTKSASPRSRKLRRSVS